MRGRRFLILVESPTKAKTLKGFLGKEYDVKATWGHLRDLPRRGMGIDLDSLSPKWVFLKGKRKLLEKIALHSGPFFIATDPDREGERIAYDIWEFLKGRGKEAWRIEFYEITPSAVKEALSSPKELNFMRVKSAISRRILDRLYGYLVSPFLWRTFKEKGLSAGRVQSCALKILVDREKERESFVPERWYEMGLTLRKKDVFFKAKLWNIKEDIPERLSRSKAETLKEKLKGSSVKVFSVDFKEVLLQPPSPLKTATLIQKASSLLHLSSARVMREAQELFERGYITYHRTDSCFLSERAIEMASHFIKSKYGSAYLKVRRYPKTGAHEAIRPTDLNLRGVSPLYDLIWKHFLASQMSDVKIRRGRVLFSWGDKVFLSTGETVLFEGWNKVLGGRKETLLPPLCKGEELKIEKIHVLSKQSQPPPRYTEASLVKELEKKGVGRPSTYATIISTLLKRGYVGKRRRTLVLTELGFKVCEALQRVLGEEMLSPEFTADMERKLDDIERGEVEAEAFLRDFYRSLNLKIASKREVFS